MTNRRQANTALALSALSFGVTFAVWVQYGVLLTYFADSKAFEFDRSQMGWLLGAPILTGSLLRLPLGVAADQFGGRTVMATLLLLTAVPTYLLSLAHTYAQFLLAGVGFGLGGASFAVGVAYVSTWFPKEKIGTALGIFGVGTMGAAFTSMCGPVLLGLLTQNGMHPDDWRLLPRIYAVALVVTGVAVLLLATDRRPDVQRTLTLRQRLAPLRDAVVWRFGLYYFLVFGGFVAVSQWAIPYFVNVYEMSITQAGFLAAAFSLPSSLVRAVGGWLSDRWGARSIMYWVFGVIAGVSGILIVPRMTIESTGEGVLAFSPGVVTEVGAQRIRVDETNYRVRPMAADAAESADRILPRLRTWQEPVVQVGSRVLKKQLIARGVTHIYYPANLWLFTLLLFVLGAAKGVGMGAVFKLIAVQFPNSVGVTGGMVGVIGGLGGVVCPILFGYLLRLTGLWTSCWFFLGLLAIVCLVWMHVTVKRMNERWKASMASVRRPAQELAAE